jgi:hypothetical protein
MWNSSMTQVETWSGVFRRKVEPTQSLIELYTDRGKIRVLKTRLTSNKFAFKILVLVEFLDENWKGARFWVDRDGNIDTSFDRNDMRSFEGLRISILDDPIVEMRARMGDNMERSKSDRKIRNFDGTQVTVNLTRYDNGRTAIRLDVVEDGYEVEPFAVASVNIPDEEMRPGEIAIKTWSENEGILPWLVEQGIVEPCHRKVPTGHVEASVCYLRVLGDEL